MKKKLAALGLAGLMILPSGAKASSRLDVIVRDQYLDSQGLVIESRTLLPLRSFLNSIGIPNENIEWDGKNRQVSIRHEGREISLRIDDKIALLDGKSVELDLPAKLIDSKTMLPARFIAESFGMKVDYLPKEKTVLIDSKKDSIKKNKGLKSSATMVDMGENLIYYTNGSYIYNLESKIEKPLEVGSVGEFLTDGDYLYCNSVVSKMKNGSQPVGLAKMDKNGRHLVTIDESENKKAIELINKSLGGAVDMTPYYAPYVQNLTMLGDDIYYIAGYLMIDEPIDLVMKINKKDIVSGSKGGEALFIGEGNVKRMTIHDGYIYYSTNTDQGIYIYSYNLSNGQKEVVRDISDITMDASSIKMFGNRIFYPSKDHDQAGLYMESLDGRFKKKLSDNRVRVYDIHDEEIYYIEDENPNYIHSYNMEGEKGQSYEIELEGDKSPIFLGISDDHIFVYYYPSDVKIIGR